MIGSSRASPLVCPFLTPFVQPSEILKQEQSYIPRLIDFDDYNCHDPPPPTKGKMFQGSVSRLPISSAAVDEQPHTGLVEAVISKQKRDGDGSDEVTAGAN